MSRHSAEVFKSLSLVHHLIFARGFHPLTRDARRHLAKEILSGFRRIRERQR
jgi:hypothetical protein